MSLVAPNEIWIHIFSFVREGRSLKSIILTCHRFHDLALPELLQRVVWTSVEKAETHMDSLETQVALRSILTAKWTVSQVTEIVNRMAFFVNLDTLSIIYGYFTDSFYNLLPNLPRLTHLSLTACHLARPPTNIPSPTTSQVTHLTMNHVTPMFSSFHTHTLYEYLFAALPHVVALTQTDLHPVSAAQLPRLTSLSIDCSSNAHVVTMLVKHYLPRLGGTLRDLHVNVRKTLPDSHASSEQLEHIIIDLPVPLLRSFTGSMYIANCLLHSATNLSSIRINTGFIKKTTDALALIEACSALPLEEIEFGVEDWDDEVLLAVMHRLPSCQHVRLFFQYSEPSDVSCFGFHSSLTDKLFQDFLFNLGIQYLPLLAKLHTLHVYAEPAPPPSPPRRYLAGEEYTEDPKQRVPAVIPEEESCVEYSAVWKKYTPALRRVQFVKGREWKREGERARWFVWNVLGVDGGSVGRHADIDEDAD
ncbi:hypothetical protein R3P38DRAFT_3211286 [Favolaschia claudopus]|uniref:F-box domain-containing protein n=1 Tax=Favolaschia claudopus TaxID=2862362 RepID=A0AAW0AG45_9AGAR